MTLTDTITLLVAASQKVDTLWTLFIQVHIAVFAFVFIYSDKFSATPFRWKALSYFSYLMFLSLNFASLSGAYAALIALHDQLTLIVSDSERISQFAAGARLHPSLAALWAKAHPTFSHRPYLLMFTHGFAALAVLAALFRKGGTTPPPDAHQASGATAVDRAE